MELTLYHTNDIHSHLSTYNKIMRFLNDKASASSCYVDLGDHVDRSHPYTEGTLGQGNVSLLNAAGADVVTIGNNEGITLTHEDFNHLYDDAKFAVTCCNLLDEAGNYPHHIVPHVIKEIAGVKLGFIGATAEFTPFYKALGWDVIEPLTAIRTQVELIKEQCDIIIILSHLGMFSDRRIAEEIADIDIILGAHTHHHFEHGERVNGVLIGAAGRYGQYIGEISIKVQDEEIVTAAKLIDSDELAANEDDFYEQGRLLLAEQVTDQAIHMPRRLYSASFTTMLLAAALRTFVKSDCALINSGLIVEGYTGNAMTRYHLHKMLPHPINPVKIYLSGRELKEVIALSMKHEARDEIVKGFGFRGDIFGMYVMDNIGFIQSGRAYYVNGRKIDDHQTYTLATLDMYTFGRFFPQFVHNEKEYIMPEFLRDVMEQAIHDDVR